MPTSYKKVIVILSAFLAYMSQATIAQSIFDRIYGGTGFDRGMHISLTSGNGYIVCGYSSSFGNNNDLYVLRLDEKGNKQWEKNFGENRSDIGWQILEMADKGLLLMGSKGIDSVNEDIWVLRLDENGNKIWDKTYGNENYERATCIFPTSDGNYLLIGQRNVEGLKNIDSYLLKIAPDGTLLWEKTFGSEKIERTFYAAEDGEGNYFISGLILPYANEKADVLIFKTDKDGNLLWQKTWGNENIHEIVHSFSRNNNGKGFTLTGYTESGKPGIHDGLYMQMDENGAISGVKKYHTGNDLRLMHSEEATDGGFICTGFTRADTRQNLWDAVLLKYDSKGDAEWMKTFGKADKNDQGYWVLVNKDGGYTFTGFTHSRGNDGNLWVIKTNPKGEIE